MTKQQKELDRSRGTLKKGAIASWARVAGSRYAVLGETRFARDPRVVAFREGHLPNGTRFNTAADAESFLDRCPDGGVVVSIPGDRPRMEDWLTWEVGDCEWLRLADELSEAWAATVESVRAWLVSVNSCVVPKLESSPTITIAKEGPEPDTIWGGCVQLSIPLDCPASAVEEAWAQIQQSYQSRLALQNDGKRIHQRTLGQTVLAAMYPGMAWSEIAALWNDGERQRAEQARVESLKTGIAYLVDPADLIPNTPKAHIEMAKAIRRAHLILVGEPVAERPQGRPPKRKS